MSTTKRSKLLKDLDHTLSRSRFPHSWWALLLLPYVPFGLIIMLLRICMSLQVLLMLLVFPEGKIKRYMLRVYLAVLGIIVTTEGDAKLPKVFVANRLSYIDHIVLHLATDCATVSVTGSPSLPFTSLLPHRTLPNGDDQTIVDNVMSLPMFDEHDSPVDYTPLVVQPECLPENGSHMLLKFTLWTFMLDCKLQPLAITVYRLWPINLTTVRSSGWWDLLWTLFVPFTYFRVKFLECSKCEEKESPDEFSNRIQGSMATTLGIKPSTATQADIDKWLADPPKPPPSSRVQREPSMPNGPVIPTSEFNPDTFRRPAASLVGGAGTEPVSSEVETMVQQVTAVMPHVPHTAIRQDLLSTHSVDQTITNILDGHVKFAPIPTLHEATGEGGVRSGAGNRDGYVRSGSGDQGVGPKVESGLFGGRKSRSAHLSLQRHMSLEERKKLLLEQARRRYIDKHGLR